MENLDIQPYIKNLKLSVTLGVLFCSLLLFMCARVGSPPGGPPDEEPPQVVETKPAHEDVAIPLDAPVIVKFDEYINKNSFESAFSISPPVGPVKLKWRGKSVELKHTTPFRENTTYVLNLGTILKDLRNNSLISAYTICFSTGATIDSGAITGRVYFERSVKPDTEVWAFKLNDTGNFNLTTNPDYITWTGKNGNFVFSFLPYDSFRVLAVEDNNGDGLINFGAENVGIASRDIHTGRSTGKINLMVGTYDTSRTYALTGESIDNQKLNIKFSKAIDTKSLEHAEFEFVDLIGETRFSEPFFIDRELRTIGIGFENPMSAGSYKVSISNLKDLFNRPISTDTVSFEVPELGDTIPPAFLEISPLRSAKRFPLDGEFRIFFSEAVESGEFSLMDTFGVEISGTMERPYPNEIVFKPAEELKEITDYRWRIINLFDFAGNQLQDTLFIKLRTLDSDTFGTLLGDIIANSYPLEIEIIELVNNEVYHGRLLESTITRQLFPGRYNIFLYNDSDQNEKLSLGGLSPFKHSEEFWVISDTIYVRSRWETEIFYNLVDE